MTRLPEAKGGSLFFIIKYALYLANVLLYYRRWFVRMAWITESNKKCVQEGVYSKVAITGSFTSREGICLRFKGLPKGLNEYISPS